MKIKCKQCRWLRTDMAGRFHVHEKAEFFYVPCYPCQFFAKLVYRAPEEPACGEFKDLVK